jgi:hypothetical protein
MGIGGREMSKQSRLFLVIAALWSASLVAVGVAAQGHAQAQMYRPLPEPKVMAGADVGFRVEGMYGEVPSGVIVIRVNDRWVEARIGGNPTRPLGQ